MLLVNAIALFNPTVSIYIPNTIIILYLIFKIINLFFPSLIVYLAIHLSLSILFALSMELQNFFCHVYKSVCVTTLQLTFHLS